MRAVWLQYLIVAGIILAPVVHTAVAMQSLVDAARREAERRNRLEQLGIEETVIEGNGEDYAGEGNVSVSTLNEIKSNKITVTAPSSKPRSSLSGYRKTLQKLDRDILMDEAKLQKLQDRLQELRRNNVGIGDLSRLSRNEESLNRAREQIEELQLNLKLKRKERAEVYDSGKKEGFLPGELEGKGSIP